MKRKRAIYNEDYRHLIEALTDLRKARQMTQEDLASRMGLLQEDISKIENHVRRIDLLELNEWLKATGSSENLIADLIGKIKG